MEAVIHAAHGEVEVVTDGVGITFTLAGRTVHRSWAGITGAGLATYGRAQVMLPRGSIELPGGKRVPFRHRPAGWDARASKAQAEQVRSISVDRVGERLGTVPAALMLDLDEALRLHLAL